MRLLIVADDLTGALDSAATLASASLRCLVARRPHDIGEARISCVNSVDAMIRLTQNGFGIAAMPPALLPPQSLGQSLHLLECAVTPPPMPFVAAARSGLEWPERLLDVAAQTVRSYVSRCGAQTARLS